MKVKKFKARHGSPFKQEDAQEVGEELENIKEKSKLTPTNVVKRAKNKKSILHNLFEWDNSEAAEKYRLSQARYIVNHVIEVVVIKGNEEEVRGFVNVIAIGGEKEYVTHTEAITIPAYRRQILGEMEATMENLLRLIRIFASKE